ncbi:SCF ubiquitin ligase complex subunit cdc4 [Paramarasmius palmivorus]|uniref:SCF ubiquitin ligase complex subunit cdc4 n=1 Tax=Paramarasmius palmivorus TaxID=297713 RepID=A0AAW0BUT6_9AGAR
MECEAQLYARLLYPLGYGYALWCPEPNEDLPADYTNDGIRLGDVGLITPDGGFDFLFNICLPADHIINESRGTPDNFTPVLWNEQRYRNSNFFKAGEPVYSRRAECRELGVEGLLAVPGLPTSAGGSIEISFNEDSGAVLMFPTGAKRVNVQQLKAFREYAQTHAANWYQFVNDTLGRDAENGSIYLVTGFDKSDSWENAVFDSSYSSQSCSLVFESMGVATGRMKLSRSSILQSSVRHRCSAPNARHNQALFIRGFRISLRQGLSALVRGEVKVASTYKSPAKDILGSTPRFSQSRSSSMTQSAGASGSGSGSRGSSNTDAASGDSPGSLNTDTESNNSSGSEGNHNSPSISDSTSVEEDDFYPPQPHHPLVFINDDILQNVGLAFDTLLRLASVLTKYQNPTVDVVVTHDDDWIALLTPEDTVMPDDRTLARRFKEKYCVHESNGIAVVAPQVKGRNSGSRAASSSINTSVVSIVPGRKSRFLVTKKRRGAKVGRGSDLLVRAGTALTTPNVPRTSQKEVDNRSGASSSSGSDDSSSDSIFDSVTTSDGLSDESVAELERQKEARAALLAQNQAEEMEFRAAKQQFAHIDLRPPKSWAAPHTESNNK